MDSWLIVFWGFLLTETTHAGEWLLPYPSFGKPRGVTEQILKELKGGLEGGDFRILKTYVPAGDSQSKVVTFIHPRFLGGPYRTLYECWYFSV